jgi:hypothetical protein
MVIPNYLGFFFIDTGYHRMCNNTVSVRHPAIITGNINRCCQQRGCSTKKEKKVEEFGGEIIETEGGVCQRY